MSQLSPDLTPQQPEQPDPLLVPPAPAVIPVPPSAAWPPATRLAFRFAFCYFLLYALCCGNATIWEIIPKVGAYITNWLSWTFFHSAQWLGQHLFHLTGVGAKLHGTGSGDTILNWIAVAVMLAVALLATLIWTALDELRSPARRSLAYPRLFFWFRLTLRLTLGVAMLGYGLAKLFPLQMAPPSLAVLNEPLGNTSPMTMLWTLIGLNPIYEMICGAAEVTAGILILFRRTSLLGTLLTAFLTTNIVLYNFCFDVPVKLYAAHLLLMSLVLLAPQARSLFNFFVLHRPSVPIDGWTRPAWRYGLRLETLCVIAVLLFALVPEVIGLGGAYSHQRAAMRHPAPLTGIWQLNATTKPFLTGDGAPMSAIIFEPSGRAMFRSSDGVLWRGGSRIDDKKHTVQLFCLGHDGPPPVYAIAQPDPSHLILTPTGKDAKTNGTLTLARVPLPSHYPLLDRGF
ncbi:MAG: hypothetical protein HIU91_15355, partial [Acidobacteria bacterium]|nr:hypothetical protein [Acidobacteriota bacterium]